MDKIAEKIIGGILTFIVGLIEGVVVNNIVGIEGYCSTPFAEIVRCNIIWAILFSIVLLVSAILILLARAALKKSKEFDKGLFYKPKTSQVYYFYFCIEQ